MLQRAKLIIKTLGLTQSQMEAQGLARYAERITPFSPVKAQAKPGYTPFSLFGSSKESLRSELLQEATGKYTNKHHSNSERLVNEIPIIWLQSDTAVCDGGGGLLGHPLEYMNLKRQKSGPETCKYCGLRFQKEDHHHH